MKRIIERKSPNVLRRLSFAFALSLMLLAYGSCLPKPQTNSAGGHTITVCGFSVMKESLEKAIFPAFAAKWKQEHGEEVRFNS